MGAIIETIGNFIYSISQLLVNFISGVFQMLVMIPKAMSFLVMAMGHIPPVLSVVIYAIVMINVVYLIIGR